MRKEDVEKVGRKAKGRKEYLRFLEGEVLTRGQAIQAKCFECMHGYADGKVDCEVMDCALYDYMPYAKEDEDEDGEGEEE